jgi:hypothetical protein
MDPSKRDHDGLKHIEARKSGSRNQIEKDLDQTFARWPVSFERQPLLEPIRSTASRCFPSGGKNAPREIRIPKSHGETLFPSFRWAIGPHFHRLAITLNSGRGGVGVSASRRQDGALFYRG